jgi:hypothetical protein
MQHKYAPGHPGPLTSPSRPASPVASTTLRPLSTRSTSASLSQPALSPTVAAPACAVSRVSAPFPPLSTKLKLALLSQPALSPTVAAPAWCAVSRSSATAPPHPSFPDDFQVLGHLSLLFLGRLDRKCYQRSSSSSLGWPQASSPKAARRPTAPPSLLGPD